MQAADSVTVRNLLLAATALLFCYYCYYHQMELLITIIRIKKKNEKI